MLISQHAFYKRMCTAESESSRCPLPMQQYIEGSAVLQS
jgi:hypothetical protein